MDQCCSIGKKVYPAAATAGKGSCGAELVFLQLLPSQACGTVMSRTLYRKQNRSRNGALEKEKKGPEAFRCKQDRRMMGGSKGQLTYPGLGQQLDLAREAGAAPKWQRGSVATGSVFCGNVSVVALCGEKAQLSF